MFRCNNNRLFSEKCTVKDYISNTKLEQGDHYWKCDPVIANPVVKMRPHPISPFKEEPPLNPPPPPPPRPNCGTVIYQRQRHYFSTVTSWLQSTSPKQWKSALKACKFSTFPVKRCWIAEEYAILEVVLHWGLLKEPVVALHPLRYSSSALELMW